MSLTQFVKHPNVKPKLKPLRPELPRKISKALRVEPRSKRYALVGTAFDYLLRFEIQRRAPHAVTGGWTAEEALNILHNGSAKGRLAILLKRNESVEHLRENIKQSISLEEASRRATKIVEDAKAAVAEYVKLKRASRKKQADLAAHAIRLVILDPIYRRGYRPLDAQFDQAFPEDVEDLLNLLGIVPFDKLIHDKILLLNPNFGVTSELVGAADTDLITSDMLVDLKTTKKGEMTADNLDQLFGYYLLACRHRQVDPAFPEIKRLAFYFSRHGYLWSEPATTWTDHPQFSEVEKWFFKEAEKNYGRPRKSGRLAGR